LHRTHVSLLELDVKPSTLPKIAAILKITLAELMDGVG